MYRPDRFKLDDRSTILRIMQEHPFGILVSGLMATHLPFTVETDDEGNFILTGHLSRANPHCRYLSGECLAIFQGPHAYISPAWYERENSVPTWDYVAVHCYGQPEILEESEHFEVVEQLIRQMEPSFMERWQQLPNHYRDGLSKGITAFRMKVDKVEATAKLSQDRTLIEKRNIIRQLNGSSNTTDHQLAGWIAQMLSRDP